MRRTCENTERNTGLKAQAALVLVVRTETEELVVGGRDAAVLARLHLQPVNDVVEAALHKVRRQRHEDVRARDLAVAKRANGGKKDGNG